MSQNFEILLLPGDGIGKEISREAEKLLNWINYNTEFKFSIIYDFIGGESIDKFNTPVRDETLNLAKRADAILLGAVGGTKWENIPFEIRPERGLLKIRKELDLFANFRPAVIFDSLIDSSSLKPEIIQSLDILIIRELTGGIYFGEPRGIEILPNNQKKGFNTLTYTTSEIERIANVAFQVANKRNKMLCSVDKANVLESTALWREVVSSVGKKFPDIQLTHMYVDNAAMQLVRNPKQFDVIVTTNMFGDILSDCASMLTGSLGMLPSASIKATEKNERLGLYEPVHGSAPDISGKKIANPIAMLLSVGMMMEYSFNSKEINLLLKKAINNVLKNGNSTIDIQKKGDKILNTEQMGDEIIKQLDKLKNE